MWCMRRELAAADKRPAPDHHGMAEVARELANTKAELAQVGAGEREPTSSLMHACLPLCPAEAARQQERTAAKSLLNDTMRVVSLQWGRVCTCPHLAHAKSPKSSQVASNSCQTSRERGMVLSRKP